MAIVPAKEDIEFVRRAFASARAQYPNLDQGGTGSFRQPPNQHSLDAPGGEFQIYTALAFLDEDGICVLESPPDAAELRTEAARWGKENDLAPYITPGAMSVALHRCGVELD